MADIEDVKAALLEQLQHREASAEVDALTDDFVAWLQMLGPGRDTGAEDWSKRIKVFPTEPGDEQLDSGVRLRIALRLNTNQNRYLISILECLAPADHGVCILTVHMNWIDKELMQQRIVEQTYTGQSDDSLRACHIIWVQNFRRPDFFDALAGAAVAILGRELVTKPPEPDQPGQPLAPPPRQAVDFPTEPID